MTRATSRLMGILIGMILLFSITACREEETTPTLVLESIKTTPSATTTLTPEPTATTTPASTITPRPSQTRTNTVTPFPSLSPTPTPTEIVPDPSVLFPFQDVNGRTVDWSYIHVTQLGRDEEDQINDLWAFIAFQLLDRGIHQRNFTFLGETITVYYLNVAHEFDGTLLPMQLVLGGTAGSAVAIEDIPAGGTAYLQAQVRGASEEFDPYIIHRDANRPYELREAAYPRLLLSEFQSLLPTLPDDIILLAEHPILIPRNNWQQIKLDMSRVSYLAARYQPFFEFNAYDRLVGQSDFAYALRDHIFKQQPIPVDFYAFSSQSLIIIRGDQ